MESESNSSSESSDSSSSDNNTNSTAVERDLLKRGWKKKYRKGKHRGHSSSDSDDYSRDLDDVLREMRGQFKKKITG